MTRRHAARTLPRFAAVTAAAALILAACSSAPGATNEAGGPTGEPVDGGTVTVAIDSDVASQFDIHVSGADISANILRNVFDSLVVQDADGEIEPWLAESWDISDDGLAYTFHLRDDVTFTDGEPFDAEAVKVNFEHVVNPDTKSQYAAALLGGDAFDSVEVVDELTVTLHLNRPYAALLQGLSTTYLGFYSPAVLASSADRLAAGGPDVTVGTGPWLLESYIDGQEIAFTKNPDYDWAPANATHTGPVHPDRLIYRILPEGSVRVGALASGEVDVAVNVSPQDVPTLEADDTIAVTTVDAPGLPWTIFLNHSQGFLQDQNVRRAVQLGIDITSAVDAVYGGLYDRAWSVLSPTTPGAYDASLEGTWEYNATEAGDLLDEAGWTEFDDEGYRTKDGERLTLTWVAADTREDRASLIDAFQADLKEIGIELAIDHLDIGAYLDTLYSGNYDIIDWSFVRPDGDILRLHLYSEYAPVQNASFVNDPQVDEWVLTASESTDPEERNALYQQVQQWVVEDAAMVPVYIPGNITASSDAIGGLRADITGWPLLYDVWTTR